MLLVSFCNGVSPEHASAPSKLQRASGEPPLSERRQPFRSAADRAFSGQGSLGLLNRVDPHWLRPLAPVDLPRPNRLGHPMSRNRAEVNMESDSTRRPCGVGPLSNDPARSLRFTPAAPCRAVIRALSRKRSRTTAPEVPSSYRGFPKEAALPSPNAKTFEPSLRRLFYRHPRGS
jgi:hypothetical protein